MEIRTNSLIKQSHSFILVDLFGYTSNGIPGLEIVNLGSEGKVIKEKFIFLTRAKKIRLPLRKFTIGVEFKGNIKKCGDSLCDLELPLLLLFWSLAGVVKIKNLENCWSVGRVDVNGRYFCPFLKEHETQVFIKKNVFQTNCFISEEKIFSDDQIRYLPLKKIMEQLNRDVDERADLKERMSFREMTYF